MVEWCCNSFWELEGTIVCNSWLNGRFSYFPVTSEETIDVDDWGDDEEPEYIGVAPQDGNIYTLVVDNDVSNDFNCVVEAEEVPILLGIYNGLLFLWGGGGGGGVFVFIFS